MTVSKILLTILSPTAGLQYLGIQGSQGDPDTRLYKESGGLCAQIRMQICSSEPYDAREVHELCATFSQAQKKPFAEYRKQITVDWCYVLS